MKLQSIIKVVLLIVLSATVQAQTQHFSFTCADNELDVAPTYAQGNGTFGNGAFAQVSLAESAATVGSTKFEKWLQPSFFRGFDVTFWCSESDCFRSLQDMLDLKATGANLAQINVSQGIVFPDPPYEADEEGTASLDSMVSYCRQVNLYYTIAVRVGPGRQDVSSDGEDGMPLSTIWTNPQEQKLYASMLKDIVQRYQSQTDTLFVGLNMIVEPNPFLVEFDTPADLDSAMQANGIDVNALYKMCIDSVRTSDPEIPLIVQSAFHSNPEFWGLLEKQEDPLVVYDFHTYDPFDYTHSEIMNSQTYPGLYYNVTKDDDVLYNKAFYADVVFARVKAFQEAHNAPIFMGEFGMQFPQNGGAQFLKDLHSIAVVNGWHFALWSYRPDNDPDFMNFDYEKWENTYWNTILSFFTANPVSVESKDSDSNVPRTLRLFQNYPNPFNPETKIEYQLPQSGRVKLVIYNLLGQKVYTLVNEWQMSGNHKMHWNGRDKHGFQVSSGLYLYELRVNGKVFGRKKMLLIR